MEPAGIMRVSRALPGGFEPPTNGLGSHCSIQLSYGSSERVCPLAASPARVQSCYSSRVAEAPPGRDGAGSDDAVVQALATFEAAQIPYEMRDDAFAFVSVTAGAVGRDEAVRGVPQGVVWRKRLGLRDVEVGGGGPSLAQRGKQRGLIHGAATSDVVKARARLHRSEQFLVEEGLRVGVRRHFRGP